MCYVELLWLKTIWDMKFLCKLEGNGYEQVHRLEENQGLNFWSAIDSILTLYSSPTYSLSVSLWSADNNNI